MAGNRLAFESGQQGEAVCCQPAVFPGTTGLIDLHRANPRRYPHLLQSTAGGRYDILFAFPGESLVLDQHLQLQCAGNGHDFLQALDDWWQSLAPLAGPGSAMPFNGGWFVYLGYELAAQVESGLDLPRPSGSLPVALATRFPCAVIRDRSSGQLHVVAEAGSETLLTSVADDIRTLEKTVRRPAGLVRLTAVDEEEPQRFLASVQRISDYIRDGDVFQVNLSRGWRARLPQGITGADLFDSLALHNPAPFSGLATWGNNAIVSSSPERLVSVRGRHVETRPIAGTRPRGNAARSDAALSSELLAHPKERAEHIMLIDLERNDLGRICIPGTIEVNELMVLESYAHVHHIVSNVCGQLRDGVLPGQVLRAVFPGGTITGCPKVRCMEIIAELERTPRGAYTGSMGYLDRSGDMDMNILIRTLVAESGQLTLRAGAGIVADSDARAELEETRDKARGVLRALGHDG